METSKVPQMLASEIGTKERFSISSCATWRSSKSLD